MRLQFLSFRTAISDLFMSKWQGNSKCAVKISADLIKPHNV